jgi:transcriptional regulator GlxA family with amidase domain
MTTEATTHARRIGILLFPDVEVLDFAGPWEVFGMLAPRANLEVLAVAESGEAVRSAQALRFMPDTTLKDCPQLDVIIVPGGAGTRGERIAPVVDFVREQADGAEVVASVCTGAFVLHSAGLLKGKRATTHWGSWDRLRQAGVDVSEERYVREGKIWTSAGVSAGIDMSLAIVGELYGEDLAKRVQLGMEYDPAPPYEIDVRAARAGVRT